MKNHRALALCLLLVVMAGVAWTLGGEYVLRRIEEAEAHRLGWDNADSRRFGCNQRNTAPNGECE